MRVLHFCQRFSPLSQTFIYDQITEQVRQGVDVHVLTLERLHERNRPLDHLSVIPIPPKWNLYRLTRRALSVFGIGAKEEHYWNILRPKLATRIQQVSPDVIHAHFGPAGVLIAPVAEKLHIPLVVSFYGHDISRLPRSSFWRSAYTALWKLSITTLVLSEEMRQAAIDLGSPPIQTRIVHLSRDLSLFPFRPPTLPIQNFVSVGRLVEKKGHSDAIKAFQEVAQHHAEIHLKIIGDGPDFEALKGLVKAHQLDVSIEFTGSLSNEEIQIELQKADAFLLCSKKATDGDKEGTPTVLIEAQAVGLPCVSTFHSGIPEMIPEENHWLLADEGDIEGLANRIMNMLATSLPELEQVAAKGRQYVEDHFNLTLEAQKLMQLYGLND